MAGLADVYFGADFIKWNYLIGSLIFVVASALQFQCHSILANLRKDNRGQIVTYQHSIPRGGLFHLVSRRSQSDSDHSDHILFNLANLTNWTNLSSLQVSCPHYFAEILIYISICIVFNGRSTTWWMVCGFVVINQLIVGLFNHQWYHTTFKHYPKSRKAVIPFVL